MQLVSRSGREPSLDQRVLHIRIINTRLDGSGTHIVHGQSTEPGAVGIAGARDRSRTLLHAGERL